MNNWRLQLQNTCNLLQQEINCIDLTWNQTGYIESGCIHDKWHKNRSMRGLFPKGLLLQIGMQIQQQTECILVSWIEISRLFAVWTDITNVAVMLSDLLRNLTFNRSAHCIQVSDQCPLGLLFGLRWKNEILCMIMRNLGICWTCIWNFFSFVACIDVFVRK